MKQALRRLGAHFAPARPEAGVRVLMYHAIDEPHPDDRIGLRVPPSQFRAQMQRLRDDGVAVIPLSRLTEPGTAATPCVAITFDDGYGSDRQAAEILAAFGYPATFFLVPRFLDGPATPRQYWESWPHLSWADAAELATAFDVGAHSATHPDLTTCSDAALEHELTGSRAALEQRLGRPVTTMSYPHGRYSPRVRDAAARAGYRIACTSRYGVAAAGALLETRRIEVSGRDTLDVFTDKVRGKYDWFGAVQRLTARA